MSACLKRSAAIIRNRSWSCTRSISSSSAATAAASGAHSSRELHENCRAFRKIFERVLSQARQQPGRFPVGCGLLYPVTREFSSKLEAPCSKFSKKSESASPGSIFIASPNEKPVPVARWLKRIWLPAVLIITVMASFRHPLGLIMHLLVFVWGTKPSPASIHAWLEQRNLQAATEKTGLDRIKDQLKFSMVRHIQVEDHFLFCLAKVTSLTESMVLLGFFGDWWVLHTSSMFFAY